MDENVLFSSAPQTVAECEAAFEQMMAEMRRLNKQMRKDQQEIDQLNAETQELRNKTRALLASLGAPV